MGAPQWVTEGVTCRECLERLEVVTDYEKGDRARDSYEVRNRARDEMGHAIYFDDDGKVALCAAPLKPGHSLARYMDWGEIG